MASNRPHARMVPTRQLHLGPSVAGVLKIVDLPWANYSENARYESPFDILPDELVLAIVKFSASRNRHTYIDCCGGDPDWKTIQALAKVCRRLNRITMPFFYRYLYHIVCSNCNHESLRQIWLPYRQDCRQLILDIRSARPMTNAHWLATTDFFTGYNRLECLTITGRFDTAISETWQLTSDLLTHMPNLKHLVIKKDYQTPLFPSSFLSSLMKHVTASRLRKLSIWRAGNAGPAEIFENRDSTAALRDLEMQGFEKDGGSVERLIRWPKQLRSFSLWHSFFHERDDHMDLAKLGQWLSAHADTLEEIDIGPLSPSGRGNIFDLSQYQSLKTLGLSRYLFSHGLESSENDVNLILAPKLEEFFWYFTISTGFFRETWDAFGEKEERWLQKLVDTAVSKSLPLKRIYVGFRPDQSYATDTWPWDHLVRLKEYCRQFGIRLHYNRPPFEREEWMKIYAKTPAKEGRDIREYFTQFNLDDS